MQSDGSKDGLGFVLYQKDEQNHYSIIAVDSRTTKEPQKLYAPIELESLAVRFALDKTQFYLLGSQEFTIFSDCLSLVNTQGKSLMNIKNQRVSKVFETLQEFNYKFLHTPGSSNTLADALSRAPIEDFFEEDDTQ